MIPFRNRMIVSYNLDNFMDDDRKFIAELIHEAFNKEFGIIYNIEYREHNLPKIEITINHNMTSHVKMRAHKIKAYRILREYTK